MIVVFGTHVKNDDISSNVFHFFKIMIFRFNLPIFPANETITNLMQYELSQEESDLLKADL